MDLEENKDLDLLIRLVLKELRIKSRFPSQKQIEELNKKIEELYMNKDDQRTRLVGKIKEKLMDNEVYQIVVDENKNATKSKKKLLKTG